MAVTRGLQTTAAAAVAKQSGAQHQLAFVSGDSLHIPVFSLLRQDGQLYKGAKAPRLQRVKALAIYRAMVRTRVLDERMLAAQRQGRLSFYLQSTGEEATTVGLAAALADDDMIMAQYREQGALIYRGFGLDALMNQLFANVLDPGKGRQMPIHYGSADLHYATISSPLATQIPQAVGYAYGQKLDATAGNKAQCTLTVFGEGAASEGDFHGALNMASVLKVPVLFLCRNNGYAISTPTREQYAGESIAARATGYGMTAIRVDGNDILAVYQAVREARKRALQRSEPVLIEAMSYRLAAHSSSDDPSGYRSQQEEALWARKDPIRRMQHWLSHKCWWTAADDKALYESERSAVLTAMKAAEQQPPPALDSLIEDVYDQPTARLQQQLAELKAHIRRYPEAYPKSAGGLADD